MLMNFFSWETKNVFAILDNMIAISYDTYEINLLQIKKI